MTDAIMFDKPYSKVKQAQGIAVAEAAVSGACLECPYVFQCVMCDGFSFPLDAWCMNRMGEILKEWGE